MKHIKILVILILALFAFTSKPLVAQEDNFIKPYGNLYVFFGYLESKRYDAAEQEETDRDTFYTINENSNLGFNFSYKGYKGVFELGISDSEQGRRVRARKAYGIYNSGFGELMIGQTWTPYTQWSYESANYYRSLGFGALYDDLTTQLKFTSVFGFYLDIIKPYVGTETYYEDQEVNPESSSDPTNEEYKLIEIEREITTKQPLENIQALFPKMAVGYEFKNKYVTAGLGAAGNIYKIDKTDDIKFNKEWIISYLFYLYSKLEYDDFSFNLSGGYAVNPANFGLAVQSAGNSTYYSGAAASIYNLATGEWEIKDTWNVQFYAEIGWAFMPSAVLHLGYGYSLVDYPVVNTETDYAMEYYLNVKFNIANLIALTPSVSYRDYMKDLDDKKEGNDIYGGILATVSFY